MICLSLCQTILPCPLSRQHVDCHLMRLLMVLIYLEDRKGSFLPTHLPSFLSSTDAPDGALPKSPTTSFLLCIALQMEIQMKWGLGMSRSAMMCICICSANWMFCISNPGLDGLRPGGGSADPKPLFKPEIDVGGSKVFIYELLENYLQDILLINQQISVQYSWS